MEQQLNSTTGCIGEDVRDECDFEIEAGMKVHYSSPHATIENGIVKSVNDSKTAAFVVYHCNNEWSNYLNYTASYTSIRDLKKGWVP